MKNNADYIKSNKIEKLPRLSMLKTRTKQLFVQLREQISLTESELNQLTSMILSDMGLKNCSVTYGGVEPHSHNGRRLKSKTYGIHKKSAFGTSIHIYKLTAMKRKERASKSVLDTLLHEIVHELDYNLIGLNRSLHTSGFYKRIGSLRQALLN